MKITDKEITDALRAGKSIMREVLCEFGKDAHINLGTMNCIKLSKTESKYVVFCVGDLEATDWIILEPHA